MSQSSSQTLSISLNADAALLERIENALIALGQWRELQAVSEQHAAWDRSPRPALLMFRASSALGDSARATEALTEAVTRLEASPEPQLIAQAVRFSQRHGELSLLARLRALQFDLDPSSPRLRQRWLESLRMLARGDHATDAVALAWQHREREPAVVTTLARWLVRSQQPAALAELRALQWNAEPESVAHRMRWLQALRLTAESPRPVHAARLAWEQREREPSAPGRVAQWFISSSRWSALAELRALEFNAEPSSARQRLRWLQALKNAAQSDQADQAVSLAWQRRDLDPSIVEHLSTWLIGAARWPELANLRALEWSADLANATAQRRFRAALRRCIERGDAKRAVSLAWQQCANDPSILGRLSTWLIDAACWAELAHLRALEWTADRANATAQRRFRAALRRCIERGDAKSAVSLVWEQRDHDASLVTRAAQWLIKNARWAALAQLRTLQWELEPESKSWRARWLEAIRLAISTEDSTTAVMLAWELRDRHPDVVLRISQWLAQYGRLADTALLRSLQARTATNPARAVLRWLEARHDAGILERTDEAVTEALSLARSSAPFLQTLRTKCLAWPYRWLISEMRLIQLAAGSVSYAMVGMHLRFLRDHGDTDEAAFFLDRVADLEVFEAADQQSLRNLLLREGRLEALERVLNRELTRTPDSVELMLRLATVHAARGDDAAQAACIARARDQLQSPGDAESSPDVCTVNIEWIHGTPPVWIAEHVQAPVTSATAPRLSPLIEHLASSTQQLGQFEIWEGYRSGDIKTEERTRVPNDIRVGWRVASFLAQLARRLRPRLIVEIGAGFGVSGMYWSSALEDLQAGALITFEANSKWHPIAERNISAISSRARVIEGMFEEQLGKAAIAPGSIDILAVDAVHTPEAVAGQLSLTAPLLAARSVVLIDDIHYSKEMYDYWRMLAAGIDVSASFEIESRMGVLIKHSAPLTPNQP